MEANETQRSHQNDGPRGDGGVAGATEGIGEHLNLNQGGVGPTNVQTEAEPARGSRAWIESMEKKTERTRWHQKDQAVGLKRLRTSSTSADHRTPLARPETEEREVETELLEDLADNEWADIERGLAQSKMQVCFLMNPLSVVVSNGCEWKLADFTTEILEFCQQNGISFEDNDLFLELKDQAYLKGVPVRQDRSLWQLMKRGYIPITTGDTVTLVWVQPAYTGMLATNLSLNELEYRNGNYVSPTQLRQIVKAVWSHGLFGCVALHVHEREAKMVSGGMHAIRCKDIAAAVLIRLFFPSPGEANSGYANYLQAAKHRTRRREILQTLLPSACSAVEVHEVLRQFGPEAVERLAVGDILLRIRARSGNGCWECHQTGHVRRNCPQLTSTQQHRDARGSNAHQTPSTSQLTVPHNMNNAERLVERVIEAKMATVHTSLANMTRYCKAAEQRCQTLENRLDEIDEIWNARMVQIVEFALAKQTAAATLQGQQRSGDQDDAMGESRNEPNIGHAPSPYFA
ncbi:hypothetical protein GN958_ATG03557 [Phytophthora infestans]|uniref:CCHC-type domain-containing protein n=1 Tax=Phytophthora infestans TaxID=4787 RepID=A0A8S9V206_PHYIN|nr:hypothetical protein GN958_ATG03557 [Phytophthora infestans]